jgi:hypothetical protein
MIGPIFGGLFFGLLPEELVLQPTIFAAELFVFLLQDGLAFEGTRMPAFPVTDLLPQFEILAAQPSHVPPKLCHFLSKFSEEILPTANLRCVAAFFKKNAVHDSDSLRSHSDSGNLTFPEKRLRRRFTVCRPFCQ